MNKEINEIINWITAKDEIAYGINMDLFAINYNAEEVEDKRVSAIAKDYDRFIGELLSKLRKLLSFKVEEK